MVGSSTGSVELHDEELIGEPREPERLVQPEGRDVVDGGVDETMVQPARAHPGERVEHERPPVALALLGGGHGEALQVAVARRRAADGEGDDRLAPARPAVGGPRPGPVDRRRPADLGEVAGVIAPRVAERGAIDLRGLVVTPGAQGDRGYPVGAPVLSQVDAQQDKGVDDGEPGAGEARRGVREVVTEQAGPQRDAAGQIGRASCRERVCLVV